jgi:hypothetical protein
MATVAAAIQKLREHPGRHRRRHRHRHHRRFGPRAFKGLPTALKTKLGYLDALGAYGDDDDERTVLPELADDDELRDFYEGLGADDDQPRKTIFGHAKPTRQGATGIEAVDRVIFDVQDAVDDLKMYANITTVAAVFSTLGVAYLVYKAAK